MVSEDCHIHFVKGLYICAGEECTSDNMQSVHETSRVIVPFVIISESISYGTIFAGYHFVALITYQQA